MTIPKRLTAVLLLLAVLLAGLLVLRPTETTLAAWSDEVTVTVPPLRTGGVHLEVSADTAGAATVGMAGDTTGSWRPSTVRVTAEGRELSGTELAGSTVEYRLVDSGDTRPTGAPVYVADLGGEVSSFAVTGGERLEGARTLLLTFVPSDRVMVEHGGRLLSLTTTIDGLTPATWTTSSSWATDQQLPPAPSVSDLMCSPGGWFNQRVTLDWDWDRAGLNQDVARWSLQVQDGSTWRETRSLPAAAQAVTVRQRDFDLVDFQHYTLRVAAVLPDGTTVPSEDTTRIRVDRFVIGAVYCA